MKKTAVGNEGSGRSHEVADRDARLRSMRIAGIGDVYMEARSWSDTIEADERPVRFLTVTPGEATHWGTMLVRFNDGDDRVHVIETKNEST